MGESTSWAINSFIRCMSILQLSELLWKFDIKQNITFEPSK